ncbi:DinB family protein [Brevibacillus nitrificans]|uniref:DinB family protein n=1 Tax=Brevibacillus nitrificans TaxID=651560 RepID=A0A3M8DBL3_9BACL|nr:DinB family protein [Brevibacillus nitrificans]RNB85376.1 DinB family protein [Brevibacillus nitrificans]
MNMEQAIQSIHASLDKIVNASQDLPEEALRWKPADDKWSVMEVLCHVEEATPYWLDEIKRLVKAPGEEWGRGLQHEGRLAAVARAAEREKQEVLRYIIEGKKEVVEVLAGLTEDNLNCKSRSRNPRFGVRPLSFIIEHLLVEHLETHIKQIERTIEKYIETTQVK